MPDIVYLTKVCILKILTLVCTVKIENLGVTSIFDLYQHDLSVDNLDLKDECKSSTNKRFYLYDKILERV